MSFDVELADLRQQSDEPLAAYYKRAVSLMQRIGAKDRPQDPNQVLTQLESAMLDNIIKAFIRGLQDIEVKKEATRSSTALLKSLRSVYQAAEEARRLGIELRKIQDEEVRKDELDFFTQRSNRIARLS